ncbi:MAG: TetR/AcrR family transcriptional regulator [Actinobacteria bacterium]|nr:TetR/AcrR family transcriptional regulator [Actinomycetota bacterium]
MLESSSAEAGDQPPKGRVPRAQREQQILAVAEHVFAKHGFEAASMEEIARASGVDRALVYQYFGGKRELYDACHTAALQDVTARVLRAIEGIGEDCAEDMRIELMRRGIRAFFEFVHEHGDGWDVLFGAGWSKMGLSPDDDRGGPDLLAWVEGMIDLSHPGAEPTARSARAAHLLGSAWAVSLWWRQSGAMTLDEITENHLELCLAVLEPLRQG